MKTLRAYIVARVLLTIPMLFILVSLVFFVVRIMPGDPVEAMLRPGVPQEYKDQIRHTLGLDLPLFLNFHGSSGRVVPDTLFLLAEPGGSKSIQVEKGEVLAIGQRRKDKEHGDWLQVALPENWAGWASPDHLYWMRQVNTPVTVLDEGQIPGTETWASVPAPEGPTGSEINAIWGEASGLLWFGTDQGVTRYSAQGWDFFEETAGKRVQAAWSGRPADLWFATDGGGVLEIKSNRWQSFTTADGLPSDRVFAVWGLRGQPVWIGTDQGAAVYDGRSWTAVTTADGLAGQQVWAIWGDDKGTFWFGTDAGLSRFDGKQWTTYTAADGLPGSQVLALWGDGQGALWVGTDAGLGRFDGQSWTTFTAADGLASSQVDAIWGDDTGQVWVGTPAGASRYDGQTWTTYTASAGLAADDVRSFWRDAQGTLWVGTAGGLNRFDSQPWLKLLIPGGVLNGWAPADQFAIHYRPFDSQYFNYLWGLLRLDLGVSLAPTRGRPVSEDLKQRFPATLELAIASLAVCILIGVPVGAFAAHKRRSAADFGARIFSIVIWAVPVFWLGLMLQLYLGVYLGDWYESSHFAQEYMRPIFGNFLPLPISGRIATEMAPRTITGLYVVDSIVTGNWRALGSTLRYMILPALTLGLYLSGVFVRLTRTNMLDVLQEDFITAARARGIRERVVVYRHALKNAFIPILTMMGLQFAALLAGAVLTETTFSWPGMGLFMWERIGYRDFNSIQGAVVFFALLVAAVSLIVDVIYAWIDPRIRY
jgi:peptide/nickel transport system permease protein